VVVFNTLTRKKDELVINNNELKIYACGPTVYNFIHIGNARPICVFDTLRRYLEYRGVKVNFVQNFTDIDDKMIKKANEEGVKVSDIADRYIAEYWTDSKGLNVKPATVHPKATENIEGIIDIVKTLENKGYAYPASNGDVYFRPRVFKGYGKLSHQPLDDLEAGARIGVGELKEDPMDFALWKGAKPGEPKWTSPWGEGRPGWHIECSAMARRYLGDTIDIHCGGQDLVFPHHENEIAQSECCTGHTFSRYWMHNAYINVDNRKMSKSLNNFFTVREISEKYGYEPIRYFMISAHYRSPINFSVDIIEQCVSALERLYNARNELDFAINNAPESGSDELLKVAEAKKLKFIEAMDDDLNTADALSCIFEIAKEVFASEGQSKSSLVATAAIFDELCDVLGILYNRKTDEIPQEIIDMANQRTEARKNRDFALADALRNKITELGYILEDTAEGPKIKKK